MNRTGLKTNINEALNSSHDPKTYIKRNIKTWNYWKVEQITFYTKLYKWVFLLILKLYIIKCDLTNA